MLSRSPRPCTPMSQAIWRAISARETPRVPSALGIRRPAWSPTNTIGERPFALTIETGAGSSGVSRRAPSVGAPARAGDEFQGWFGIVPWDELTELGIRFTALCVVAGAKDSIESVLRWREFLGDHVDYVLALNQRDDLSIFMSSRARDQFNAAGVVTVEIPKLDERFAAALDRANWTLSAALASTDPNFLTQIMSRARLRRYRDQVFTQFESTKPLLIP